MLKRMLFTLSIILVCICFNVSCTQKETYQIQNLKVISLFSFNKIEVLKWSTNEKNFDVDLKKAESLEKISIEEIQDFVELPNYADNKYVTVYEDHKRYLPLIKDFGIVGKKVADIYSETKICYGKDDFLTVELINKSDNLNDNALLPLLWNIEYDDTVYYQWLSYGKMINYLTIHRQFVKEKMMELMTSMKFI